MKSLISEVIRRKKKLECSGHGIGEKHLPGCHPEGAHWTGVKRGRGIVQCLGEKVKCVLATI